MTFEDIKKIREACLVQAEELLAAAKEIEPTAPHIAYHLATLALEEVGKTHILLFEVTPGHREEALRSFEKMREDHVKKLFWALWGPTFTRQQVGPDQMRGAQGLATWIHDRRLSGLYVDWDGVDLLIPRAAISPEHARTVTELAEARISLERSSDLNEPTPEEREVATWFLSVAGNREHAGLLFGRKSIDRLNELGDAREWVAWLKRQFEEQDRTSRELLERELARQEPAGANREKPKWLIRFRLFTPSHSVRQRILEGFNKESSGYIKLTAAKSNQLIVDYVLPAGLHVGALWDAGLSVAEHVLLALNVASCGFFWWQPSRYTATYFERVEDLEAKSEIRVERVPKLEVGWGNNVLDQPALNRMVRALDSIPLPSRKHADGDPYGHYLDGLAFLGKTDLHLQLEVNAFESFFKAFKTATKLYGDWDGIADFRVTTSTIIDRVAPGAQSWLDLVGVGIATEVGVRPEKPIDLGVAAGMKVWCDLYLLKAHERVAAERQEGESKGENSSG